jgi:diguanylate cyclase (GGDEF)-like protein
MTNHPEAELLVSFICLLALVAGVAWGCMTRPLRIAPRASIRFFFANCTLGAGVYLLSLRTAEPSLLYWFVADLAMLASFALIGWGIQHLFKLRSTVRRDVAVLLVASLLMLAGQQDQQHQLFLGIVFSLAACFLFFSASKDYFVSIQRDFGFTSACLMATPTTLAALIFLIRALILAIPEPLAHPYFATSTEQAMGLLWSYIVLTLSVNIVMIGGALARLVAKIRQFAERDQLTGLWNRRAILKKLQHLHELWEKQQQSYSLILLDLDHFKQINDSFGHDAGDAALRRCATTLTGVLRNQDLVSRYGGEEFLLVFPAVSAEELPLIAEKIRLTLASCHLIWQNQPIELSGSLGYISVYPGAKAEHLLTLADSAMYQAKSDGRNKACAAVVA